MVLPYVPRPGFTIIVTRDLVAGRTVATHIAVAAARGSAAWADCPSPGKVLLLPIEETSEAVLAAHQAAGATPDVMQNIIVEKIARTDIPRTRLESALTEHKPVHVLLDPLLPFVSGDIKEKDTWKTVARLREEAQAADRALVGIIHADLHKKTLPKNVAAWIGAASSTHYCWTGDEDEDGTSNILMAHYHIERGKSPGVAQEFTLTEWVQARPGLTLRKATMPSSSGGRAPTKEDGAQECIKRLMAEGLSKGADIRRRAADEGFTKPVLYRARDLLGVQTKNKVWVFPGHGTDTAAAPAPSTAEPQEKEDDEAAADDSAEPQSQSQANAETETRPGGQESEGERVSVSSETRETETGTASGADAAGSESQFQPAASSSNSQGSVESQSQQGKQWDRDRTSSPLASDDIKSGLLNLPSKSAAEFAPINALFDDVERDRPLDPDQELLTHRDSDGVKLLVRGRQGLSYVTAPVALKTMGGKKRFQQQFAHLMPMGPVPLFIDAMVGGGSITLAAIKGRVARSFWLNDLNPSVAAFYRVCADERLNSALRERLHISLNDIEALAGDQRALLSHYMALLRSRPTDELLMAERYLIINRLSFNGAIGYPMRKLEPYTRRSVDALSRLTILRDVKITNLDVSELLTQVPEGSFVFFDPPYLTNPGRYSDGHQHFDAQFDHEKFVGSLKHLAHRGIMFMLTYDEAVLHDPVLGPMIIAEYRTERCRIEYQNGRDGVEGAVEVAIMNYRSSLSVKPDI